MENKVIKNMEYWKKKNNIPGIEALADSGLTDGRAGSSAFQMAAPVTPSVFGEDENTEVGKELLKEEAKEAMQKSPLEQKVESKTIAGQNITKTEEGFMYSPGEGMEPIPVKDPNGVLKMTEDGFVMDNDYKVEEGEGGLVIRGVSGAEEAPGMPDGPGAGAMGGVGETPMEMQSPVKNYKKGYYGIK